MTNATTKKEEAELNATTLKKLIEVGHETHTIPEDRQDLRQHYSDEQDFWEVSAWGLKKLLAAAYELGKQDATKSAEVPVPTSPTRSTPFERTRAAVYATGNRWAIENFNNTH